MRFGIITSDKTGCREFRLQILSVISSKITSQSDFSLQLVLSEALDTASLYLKTQLDENYCNCRQNCPSHDNMTRLRQSFHITA